MRKNCIFTMQTIIPEIEEVKQINLINSITLN